MRGKTYTLAAVDYRILKTNQNRSESLKNALFHICLKQLNLAHLSMR